jgi:hypothetical protein
LNPGLVQRQAGLAAAALLACIGALVLGSRGGDSTRLPPPAPVVRWETVEVGVLPAQEYAKTRSCGTALDSSTIGIAHPLLPCGVDLVVALNGRAIRTEVVARTPVATDGPEFELTQALAEELGLKGEEAIQWRFAD